MLLQYQTVVDIAVMELRCFSNITSLSLSLFVSLSAKTRLAGLESLRKAFSSKVLYDFLTERRLTVSDCLERSLKKGKMRLMLDIETDIPLC